jgi:hypothetical protein
MDYSRVLVWPYNPNRKISKNEIARKVNGVWQVTGVGGVYVGNEQMLFEKEFGRVSLVKSVSTLVFEDGGKVKLPSGSVSEKVSGSGIFYCFEAAVVVQIRVGSAIHEVVGCFGSEKDGETKILFNLELDELIQKDGIMLGNLDRLFRDEPWAANNQNNMSQNNSQEEEEEELNKARDPRSVLKAQVAKLEEMKVWEEYDDDFNLEVYYYNKFKKEEALRNTSSIQDDTITQGFDNEWKQTTFKIEKLDKSLEQLNQKLARLDEAKMMNERPSMKRKGTIWERVSENEEHETQLERGRERLKHIREENDRLSGITYDTNGVPCLTLTFKDQEMENKPKDVVEIAVKKEGEKTIFEGIKNVRNDLALEGKPNLKD